MSKSITTPAAQPKSKRLPIDEFLTRLADDSANAEDGEEEPAELGKIAQILKCYAKGYKKSEIVKAGFNKSTVYRQCGEFDKMKKGPIKTFHGFEMYEARINRVMRTKDMTREKAAEWIAAKDEASDND